MKNRVKCLLSNEKKSNSLENVYVSMEWIIYMKCNVCVHCLSWLSVQYNNKKLNFGFKAVICTVFLM